MNRIVGVIFMFVFSFGYSADVSAQKAESADSRKPKSSRLSSKYDKSKNLTTVRIKQFTITTLAQEKQNTPNIPLHQMGLEIWYSFSGQKQTIPIEDVVFRFHAVASNYVFSRGQQVITALDRDVKGQDRAISLGMTDYKSEPPKFNSVYEEFMEVKIPAEALSRMAKAKTVEIFVGPVGYMLTEKQFEILQEIATNIFVVGSQ